MDDLSRGTFVSSFAAAAFLRDDAPAAAAPATPPPPSPAERARLDALHAAVPFRFDRVAFQAILDTPYPHRQSFVFLSFERAAGYAGVQGSLNAYADPNGFAAGPHGLHVGVVLLGGHALVLDDAMWRKYPIGLLADEEMHPTDTTYRAYWTNLKHNQYGETHERLVAQDVAFFVCNNSFTSYARGIAQRTAPAGTTLTRERIVAVHDELAAHFLPNTMLVPAGVAAINALQEARFTYCP
jgi:intracellular sulfur oxidation DsrE/DsrF family protein